MRQINELTLGLLALAVGAVSLALSALLMRSGGSPIALHPLVCGGILLWAALLVWAGWAVRKLKRREETRMTALRAANILVAAQTSMLLGAGVFGHATAQLILVASHVDAAALFQHAVVSVFGLACGCILVAAGRIVERWCTIDDDPEDDPPSSPGRAQPAGA